MGLTEWMKIRQWIKRRCPQCIGSLPASSIPSCVHLDFTQVCRHVYPHQAISGEEFASWMFNHLREHNTTGGMVVGMMDKPSYVPPEKAFLQKKRSKEEAPPVVDYSNVVDVPINADGLLGVPFHVMDVMRCRKLRGALIDWFVDWLNLNPTCRPIPGVRWFLSYEYPLLSRKMVEVRPDEIRKYEDNPVGEADVACLSFVRKWHGMRHVSMQIDSDVVPIALLHLESNPTPPSWVFTTSNFHGNGECYDLVTLHRAIQNDPTIDVDPGDRVCCFVLWCILTETDYFKSKQRLSRHINPEVLFVAIQRNWAQWDQLWMWFVDTNTVRRSHDLCTDQWTHVYEMQRRWQYHVVLLTTKYEPEDTTADKRWLDEMRGTPLEVVQYQRRITLRSKTKPSFSKYGGGGEVGWDEVHAQLWFSIVYWTNPRLA